MISVDKQSDSGISPKIKPQLIATSASKLKHSSSIDMLSPIYISDYEIYKVDEKLYFNISIKNFSDKIIEAIHIKVNAFTLFGKAAEGKTEYLINQLNLEPGNTKKSSDLLPLENSDTRSLEIVVSQISYTDSTIDNISEHRFVQHHEDKIEDEYLPFVRKRNSLSKYYPYINEDYWGCTCGMINSIDKDICPNCNSGLQDSLTFITPINLNILLETQNKDRKLKTIKTKHRLITLAGIAVIIVIVALSISKIIMPAVAYEKAGQYMQSEDYSKAHELYDTLGTYKDSKSKMQQAEKELAISNEYEQAMSYYQNQDYGNAISILSAIPDYKASSEILNECHYKMAKILIDKKDYETAISMLKEVSGYSDIDKLLTEASQLLEKQQLKENDKALLAESQNALQRGNVDLAYEKLIMINEPDAQSKALIQEIEDCYDKYNKWLGLWSIYPKSEEVAYYLTLDYNNGVKLILKPKKWREKYDLVDQTDTTLLFHSDRYGVFWSYQLEYTGKDTMNFINILESVPQESTPYYKIK